MEQSMFKIFYGIGFIMIFIIRLPNWWRAKTRRIVVDRKTARDVALFAFLSVGVGALPLVYVFTPWLSFADYRLPSWVGWTGAAIFALALWLLWRAHAALGPFWSDSLQRREGHPLITSGIYGYIRHPMYAFGWLLGIAQALLLQNWIAGLSGLVSFALLYFLRVPREEQMMLDQFGEEYRAYMNRTGRIIPRVKSGFEDKERS
jgi:protein-S-isoprenylcysteine O-methyltransferase Ste14